jgi:hypothetical protein
VELGAVVGGVFGQYVEGAGRRGIGGGSAGDRHRAVGDVPVPVGQPRLTARSKTQAFAVAAHGVAAAWSWPSDLPRYDTRKSEPVTS